VSPAASRGLARPLEFDSPAERAAAELRGWLEAGERVVALLAPRGPLRRRALAILAASLEGRFLAARWPGDRPAAPRQSTLDEVRGKTTPTLFLVEDGERLGAEGARVLRALAQDPSAAHCVAVALDAQEAGPVLGGLGPELEIVVLREAAKRRLGALRIAAQGAVLGVAGVSFGVALALLLPRFAPPGEAPEAPASAPVAAAEAAAPTGPESAPAEVAVRAATVPPPAASLPAVGAPPPVATGPERTKGDLGTAPRTPAAPTAGPGTPPPSTAAAATAPPAAPTTARAAAAPGFLVVNAIPRAWISLDGAVLGETPIVRHPVAGGAHRVSARFEDGREEERGIEIAGGELYLMFDGRAPR